MYYYRLIRTVLCTYRVQAMTHKARLHWRLSRIQQNRQSRQTYTITCTSRISVQNNELQNDGIRLWNAKLAIFS